MVLALAFGVVIWPIGQIGSMFALLITSAVNRQREFLADASAVQYTRNPTGLCEALTILLHDEIVRSAKSFAFVAVGQDRALAVLFDPVDGAATPRGDQ